MSPSLRRRLRLARRGLWYTVAIGLVVMALGSAVFSQLLPLAEGHPELIARWLGERSGRAVAFDRVETDWTRRGPLLRLEGLRLGEGAGAVAIGDAEVLVSQYAGLLPGRSFTELRVRGLDLTMARQPDGTWQVRGLPGHARPGGDPFAALEGLGELQVIGARLHVLAPGLAIDALVPRVDLRLRVDGDRVRAGLRAWMHAGEAAPREAPLSGAFEFERGSGNGRGHVHADRLDLDAWSPLLHLAGVSAEAGRGQGDAWVRVRGHRVERAILDASVDGLRLQGAPLEDGHRPGLHFDHVQARARWQREGGQWRLDAPVLRFGRDQDARVLDGLAVSVGGAGQALAAGHLDAGPLFALAALSDRVRPAARRWLLQARPRASIDDVLFSAAPGGRLQARARIRDAGFRPVGDAPGFSGLAGSLRGDADAVSLQLDPDARFRIDWPRGFGVQHEAVLAGTVTGWREGDGWRVATDALQVRGAGFGLDLRGGMWFQGDGSRPRVDLAANVQPTPLATARGFWIHNMMSPATVRWLEQALQGGRIERAHALVSGDLDDWPFRDERRAGRFQVDARIADATLKFHPGWPAAEHVDADVTFLADSFHLDGKGVLDGVGIRSLDAGIEHFGRAVLDIAAQGGGDAAQLLSLLRNSPLHAVHGDTLDNLRASGLASVTFGMELPLHADAPPAVVTGTVALAGAKLADRRWDLAFENVRGRANYGSGGFRAERLAVRHLGQPGRLSLRAGDYTRDRAQAFEAELQATLASDGLLRRVGSLAWLQPRVHGRSEWTAQLSVPRASRNAAAPARLRLQSDLAGTALDLPAPLDKPGGVALATTIETTLPTDAGDVSVTLGNRMALRARGGASTGVRVLLGGDRVSQPPPASGLAIAGNTGTLDALGWIGVARDAAAGRQARPGTAAGNTTAAPAFPLRSVDVTAASLQLFGAAFEDTRVRLEGGSGAIVARLQGDDIVGEVRVPDTEGATVAGRFQRLRWPLPGPGTSSAGKGGGSEIDPALLPPFSVDIDRLSVGGAELGSAVLRTRPVPAGLRIVQLQTRSPKQRIDVQGDWLGSDARARTRVGVVVHSEDFGKLLGGLGYGGQLDGGSGRATLDATWPGGPAGFSLLALDGALELDARDGQLTEIEPGAGRVLGLLGVAQLPRRLTLDFSDFFERGFAFDRIDGTIRIAGARASSDRITISGPAAEIAIRGSADLRAQRFDQVIAVEPRTGNLLAAVGAIAAGPMGAAIGAAANAVLRKPLGELSAKTYRVSGPWKDPTVEVIGRGPPQQATAAASAPPPG